jgi:hypothetical protein
MRRWIRKVLFAAGGVVALIGVARFCHHATKGFRLSKIESNYLVDPSAPNASEEELAFMQELFQQKFRFLSRGFQSFVFVSEDGNYVLKLFNNRHQTKAALFSVLTWCPLLKQWAQKSADYHENKLTHTFTSYRIAFDAMKERTGLVYLHLSPTTNLPDRLEIVDPLNISHEIDPNTTGFLIQKRATLVYPALKEYMASHDVDEAKRALSSLVELFFWKWGQAIGDNDPLIRTNYGFVEGRAMQLDVGPLSMETQCPSAALQQERIQRITARLKFWLHENAPELVPFLEEEIGQQLSSLQ